MDSVFTDANNINVGVFNDLNNNLSEFETKISQYANDPTSSFEISGQFFSDIQSYINNSIGDIATSTSNILSFTDNYKDFVAQNLVNQEITNMYQKNQQDNVDSMSSAIQQDNDNKLRMVEINNYYIKKNEYLNGVMKIVLIGLAILLIIVVLAKKEIIPQDIARFLGILIAICIIGYGIYVAYDLSRRDKFNFDQYVMPFDLTAKMKEASGNMIDIGQEFRTELHPFITGSKGLENVVGCIGESCCSTGTVYDIGSDQCITVNCNDPLKPKHVMVGDGSYNCQPCPTNTPNYNSATNQCY